MPIIRGSSSLREKKSASQHEQALERSTRDRRQVSFLVQRIGFLRERAIGKTERRLEELRQLHKDSALPLQKKLLQEQIALHEGDLMALKGAQAKKAFKARPNY